MTLHGLFDKDRKADIKKALAKGEAIPSARRKGPQQPVLVDSSHADTTPEFIEEINRSASPTKEKLERVMEYIRRKAAWLDSAYSVDEFDEAQASANQKMKQKANCAPFTQLEQEILQLQLLNKLATSLQKRVEAEDEVKGLIKGKDGRAGP